VLLASLPTMALTVYDAFRERSGRKCLRNIEAALVKAWASLSHVKAELMLARREKVIALSYLFVHLGEIERKTFMTN
jgi:hypothetical protein